MLLGYRIVHGVLLDTCWTNSYRMKDELKRAKLFVVSMLYGLLSVP